MRILTLLAALLVLAPAALADTINADFEGGANLGNWTFGHYSEGINATGGNPGGWYYVNQDYWTFAPIFKCGDNDPVFAGDYAARGVTGISGDFRTDYCENDPWANTFAFAAVFRNNMGTPNDPYDDVYVYQDPGSTVIPQIGAGWTHYEWTIPSDFVGGPGELPAGWMGGSADTGGDIFPADRTFQDVMANVTNVEFWWLHPAFFAIVVPWEVGADNITIEFGTPPIPVEESNWGSVKALFR